MTAEDVEMLTYREAAKRVHRSVDTIKRWRALGMPMGWAIQHGQLVRVVRRDVLMEHYRKRLLANPIYHHRRKRHATDSR